MPTHDTGRILRAASTLYTKIDRSLSGKHPAVHVLFGLLYYVIGVASYRFANIESTFSGTFYLHEGYALAIGAAFGLGALPGLALGHFALAWTQGASLGGALLSSGTNVLVVLAAIGFLKSTRFDRALAKPKDYLLLVGASLFPYQMLSRLLGIAMLSFSGMIHDWNTQTILAILWSSLIDESVYQVLIAAVMLTSLAELSRLRPWSYWLKGLAATVGLACVYGFMLWRMADYVHPLHALSFLYLIVMIMTFGFGLHGAAISNLAMLFLLQWANNQHVGPLNELLTTHEQQDSASTFLVGIMLSSCLVGALLREKADKESALVELATRDSLTGLYNRRFFFSAADREARRTAGLNGEILLLCIDLDHFKVINDTRGHAAGDDVLVAMGEILRRECRQTDIAARIGGEEFAILAPDANASATIAERLREAIRQTLSDNPTLAPFTISIGITRLHPSDQTVADAMKRADQALYEAKHLGRDCIVSRDWEPARAPETV
ncbi:MAG: sensor domain-containing diguanylate cyclase [Burkholderiales bacterium]|nr:sensor domain-containing diguanylate cyclase [Burkholderiales bacterium]